MDIGVVQQESVVGGVWAIAAVTAEADWHVVDKKGCKTKDTDAHVDKSIKLEHKFEASYVGEAEGEEQDFLVEWPEIMEGMRVEAEGKKDFVNRKVEVVKKVGCKKILKEERIKGSVEKDLAQAIAVCAVPLACCTPCHAPPGLGICPAEAKRWRTFHIGEITVDSAAEESVCPQSWCHEFGTREAVKKLEFVNASGGEMGHYGERVANFKVVVKGFGNHELELPG
jgi:hypothetical protein